jgi:hypothetical protein
LNVAVVERGVGIPCATLRPGTGLSPLLVDPVQLGVRRVPEADLPDGLRDEEASGPTAHPPRLAAPARSTGSATTPSSLEHALTGPLGSCP